MTLPTHIVAVGGLVRRNQDEILLVRNPRRGWEFPGGMVDEGESLPQALIREIREESGITARVENMAGLYSNTSAQPGYGGVDVIPTIVNIDFICAYLSGEVATSPESLETGWFLEAVALEMVSDPYLRHRLRAMLTFPEGIRCAAFTRPFDLHEEYLFER